MRLLFLLISALLLAPVFADPVEDIFGAGVFSTSWGMTKDEIQTIHPESEYVENKKFNIKSVILKGDKPVLGIKRDEDSQIVFSLDYSGKLNKITIGFGDEDYATLLLKLNQLLGAGTDDLKLQAKTMGMVMGVKYWEGNNKTKVLLFSSKSGAFSSYKATLSIEVPPSGEVDKKSLGLD